jgi:hypothetical protein
MVGLKDQQQAIWVHQRTRRIEIAMVAAGQLPDAGEANRRARSELGRYRTADQEPPKNPPLTAQERAVDRQIQTAYAMAVKDDISLAAAWRLVSGRVAP